MRDNARDALRRERRQRRRTVGRRRARCVDELKRRGERIAVEAFRRRQIEPIWSYSRRVSE